jgi:hypothetical protein
LFHAKIEGCFILPHVPHSPTSPYYPDGQIKKNKKKIEFFRKSSTVIRFYESTDQ